MCLLHRISGKNVMRHPYFKEFRYSITVCVFYKLHIRESEERSQVIADGRQSHVNSHHRRHHHRTHVSSNSNYFTYLCNIQ